MWRRLINVLYLSYFVSIPTWGKYCLVMRKICWGSIRSGGNRFNKATVITLFSFDCFLRFIWQENIALPEKSSYYSSLTSTNWCYLKWFQHVSYLNSIGISLNDIFKYSDLLSELFTVFLYGSLSHSKLSKRCINFLVFVEYHFCSTWFDPLPSTDLI